MGMKTFSASLYTVISDFVTGTELLEKYSLCKATGPSHLPLFIDAIQHNLELEVGTQLSMETLAEALDRICREQRKPPVDLYSDSQEFIPADKLREGATRNL
ncbi:hypothetical protein VKT23_014039 [Stygiomarasmius scandens]|uniref:Uncharacterized protein n=1 Tax=Marasmiellus scandens TaxID=2682957 RepID=A0ABR1J4B6_9AGAR